MAKELFIGVVIGAAVSGAFKGAFAGAERTVKGLGTAVEGLTKKQVALGKSIERGMKSLSDGSLAALNRDYEALGRTIDRLRTQQDKLTASIARGKALGEQRQALKSQIVTTGASLALAAAPAIASLRLSGDFGQQLRRTATNAEFDAGQEARVGSVIRKTAVDNGLGALEIGAGTQALVAGGIQDEASLNRLVPLLGRASRATGNTLEELALVSLAFRDNLQISADGVEPALNILVAAGKAGSFEVDKASRALPQIAPMLASLGVVGNEAVAEIGASLQIAKQGAGSAEEAANNYVNALAKISAPETVRAFEKAGIDLQAERARFVAQGLTPMQAMLRIIGDYVRGEAPGVQADFQALQKAQTDSERAAILQRLEESDRLGELFVDRQAAAFFRIALAKQPQLEQIRKSSLEAAKQNQLVEDWKRNMDTLNARSGRFRAVLGDLGISIGNALAPQVGALADALVPVITSISTFVQNNPGLVKAVVGAAIGFGALKIGVLGLRLAWNVAVLSPLNFIGTAITGVGAKVSLFRVLVSGAGGRLSAFFQILGVGPKVATALARGVTVAGRAVLFLGRALLLNPIGLAITAIAGGAFLIYKFWGPIKGFFSGLWAGVDGVFKRFPILNYVFPIIAIPRAIVAHWGAIKGFFSGLWGQVMTAFSGGIGGVLRLVLSWSPMGTFARVFSPVVIWLGTLPGRFADAGSALIDGLIGGIAAKATALKDAVVGIGSSVAGWFKEKLGIASPSRVFMGFGGNVSAGAALGIRRGAGAALAATALLAAGIGSVAAKPVDGPSLSPPTIQPGSALAARSAAAPRAAGSEQSAAVQARAATDDALAGQVRQALPAAGAQVRSSIVFSPSIQITGADAATVGPQVDRALQLSMVDFERMLERVERQRARRAF
ncbi:MAG: phage tail tape measure protein [Xanthomonadaceae bacterium]|nr:phage tail tape measure protein [Xanthomonadaceae bacterium]